MPKNALIIFFSGVSNLRSLQATDLKFAEYVEISVQIIYTKFKNDRTKDNGYTGCTKMEPVHITGCYRHNLHANSATPTFEIS